MSLALAGVFGAHATAATLYWDPNGNAAGIGGAGTWNTTNAFWNSNAAGTGGTVSSWNNATLDRAVFGGTAGAKTVVLGVPVTVSGLSFAAAPSYSLNGTAANPITLAGGAPSIDVFGTHTIVGVLDGTSGYTKTGNGTLVLSATNNVTGTISVNAGVLRAGVIGSRIGNPVASSLLLANTVGVSFDLNNLTQVIGSLAGGGALGGNVTLGTGQLQTGTDNSSTTYEGVISGSGTFAKMGTGTLTLIRQQAYSGTTFVSGGTLRAGVTQMLNPSAQLTVNSNGTFDLNGFDQTAGPLVGGGIVNLNAANLTIGTSTGTANFTGRLVGNGGLIKNGASIQSMGGFFGGNTYSGATVINAGTLRANVPNLSLSSLSAVIIADVAGATLDLANTTQGAGSLAGGGATGGAVTLGSGTLTTGNDNTSATFAGIISGTGGLTKTGSGVQTLTGASTYTGVTTVNAGALRAGAAASGQAFGRLSAVTIADVAGAALDLGGFDQTIGSLSGGGVMGGLVALGVGTITTGGNNTNTAYAGVIKGTGGVIKTGTATQTLTGDSTYTGATTIAAGTLQLGNGGTTGSIVGDVRNSGALIFNRSNSLTYAGVVSGTGTLTQAGAGTTILTGNHLHTGGTTISAGTLQLGNGGATGSVTGNVTNNAGLAFDRSDTVTFAGVISGSGSVSLIGTGTTVLSEANTYTGGTTIAAGTLQIGNNNFTGSIVGDVVNNATLAFDRTNFITFGGVISGSGNVRKISVGTLILTGDNSYAGGTALEAGALRVEHDHALGSGALAMAAGTTLDFGGSRTLANAVTVTGGALVNVDTGLSGALQGPIADGAAQGALTKTGTGTLVLQGNNTYTGGTTITAGTLQVGNGGTSGSLVGDIANDAALVVNRSDALSLGGVISGAGTVTKLNGNTLTLSGANTYSGGTALKGGQITVGHNTALGSGPLAMDEGTTLGFSVDGLNLANAVVLTGTSDPIVDTGAFTEALSGVISGGGTFTKSGSGTLVLSGANTYTGATLVAAGSLRASAANAFSAASAHTVAPGATLDTAGFNQRVSALTNGGTVSLLGATAGSTLTTSGPYVGNAGLLRLGTVRAGNASASDRLVLDGPGASASGSTTIQIANVGGLGALTSGNGIEVVSAFNGATTTAQTTRSAFSLQNGRVDAGAFEYRLYAADATGAGENWYLRSTAPVVVSPTLTPVAIAQPVQPTQPVQPVTPGQPPSPSAQPQPSPSSAVLPIQVPTYRTEVPLLAALPAQFRQADLAMLGNLHRRMGDEAPAASTGSIDGNLARDASEAGQRRAWGRVVYADLGVEQPGVAQAQSDGHVSGLQAGTDLWVNPQWRAGVYVGYLDGSVDVTGNARGLTARVGSNEVHSRFLGAYATWMDASGWYVDSVLQGSSQRYEVKPDINPRVSGKASSFTASVEAGKAFALNERWSIEPQTQLAYQHSSFDDLVLGGARVRQDANGGWIGRLGVRVKGDFATSGGRLQPYGRLNLYHANFGDDAATFIGPAGAAAIASGGSYSAGEVAAGATLALTQATSIYGEIGHLWSIRGDATVKSSVQASLGIKVRW